MVTQKEIDFAHEWFEIHKGINFLDWPDELKKHSFPMEIVHIPSDLAEGIYSIPIAMIIPDFTKLLKPAIDKMKNADGYFFAKWITRSPKDVCIKFRSIGQLLLALRDSMRSLEDVVIIYKIDMCYMVIRPWIEIPKEREFRVFVNEGEITGISQYWYKDVFPYVVNNRQIIERSIRRFVNNTLISLMPVKSFSADLMYEFAMDQMHWKIIEANYYWLSDPCLFKDHTELDGSFKIRTEPYEPKYIVRDEKYI